MSSVTKPIILDETGKRIAEAIELIAINQSGDVNDVQNWKAVQNIVRAGLGKKAFPVGTQFLVEKETSMSASMGAHTGITAVSVAEETFLAAEGIVGTGLHEFKYDGAAWIYNGNPVSLTTFGITVTGTPAEGDEVLITEAFQKIVFDVVDHPDDSQIPDYSTTSTYAMGKQVKEDGFVWVCTTTIGSAEAWNASHWTKLHEAGQPRMVLLMHSVIYGRAFDASEAVFTASEAMTAGDYYFVSADGNTYYPFTTTQEIPQNGQVCLVYTSDNITGIKTYSGAASTSVIETINITSTGTQPSGTNIGKLNDTMNHTSRCRYGSNNYKESDLRQWLNSGAAANAWWSAQSKYDRPSGYANVAGFMHGMDSDFLAVVGLTKIPCKTNNTSENTGWTKNAAYVVEDKFFLASRDEIGYGAENVQEGYVFSMYNGAANVDKIKYDITAPTTARYWFHRSPTPGYAHAVRGPYVDGSVSSYYAYSGYGAVAACEIK